VPFVSYLTTVYNKAPYLPATIEALLNQEGDFEREFIFVDDGSTDDSVAVIQRCFENTPYTPIIITQSNQGPARALNAAFAAARGEYLKPMDADDILHPAATRLLLQALKEHQVHVAFCDLHEGDVLSNALPTDISFTRQRYFRRALKKNIANPSAFLLTRHALYTIAKGGTEGCYPNVFIQDYGLEIRLAFAFEWVHVPLPLVLTPKGEGHLSGNVAQTLHDINAVLASFVAEHGDDMSSSDLRFAYKRAAGRAFLWQRRNNGLDALWLSSFVDFFRSRILPKKRPTAGDFWRTTLPYKKSSNIR
jgi:glycosyltransferase involved in cell wall biosynthesis